MDEESIWPKLQPLPNEVRQTLFGDSTINLHDVAGNNRLVAHSQQNNIDHFSRNSARYNGVLSISATGIDNGKGGGWERIQGPHAVKLCGRTYHYLPKSNSTGGIHHFILDKYTEALMHAQSLEGSSTRKRDTTIKDSILKAFWDSLHTMNKFVQQCKIIGDAVNIISNQNYPEEEYEPAVQAFTPEVIAQINSISSTPHLLDVASVTDDSVKGKRVVQFKVKGSKNWRSVPITHPHIEPLSYPILFLGGEEGWGMDIRHEIHFPQYIVSRMLMPEDQLFVRNSANTKWILTNRFQLFARVAQYWLCDCVSRSIEIKLEWIRNNQSYFTDTQPTIQQLQNGMEGNGGEADLPDGCNTGYGTMESLDDTSDYNNLGGKENERYNDETNKTVAKTVLTPDQPGYRGTGKTFLSSEFHGSRRHLKKLSQNGLIVVSAKGPPHLFITLTCNTDWPEIKERLFYGQTAFDRPDVTTQVFKARLTAFLHNLRNGKYFRRENEDISKHRLEYEMMCIEYQHRGLPHAHIVVRLSDMPDDDDRDNKVQWIKDHIHSCAPRPHDCDYYTEARRDLVRKHMLHTCSNAVNGCLKDGICKRGYDALVLNNGQPSFGETNFPIYGKREEEDLRVVPHHIFILEDWDGHVNVEFCGSHYTPVYLYQYLFKGAKKERFRLTNAEDIADDDEINLHIRAQVISSMDSMWRVMGYETYPATNPSVILVHAQLLQQMNKFVSEKKVTDLYVYFNRPNLIRTGSEEPLPLEHNGKSMNDLNYLEFYTVYCYSRTLRSTMQKKPTEEGRLWWKLNMPNGVVIFVTKRFRPEQCIVRMNMLYSSAGEVYYLRMLLNHYATRSFQELLLIPTTNIIDIIDENNTAENPVQAVNTFQEACLHRGLLNDLKEAIMCFEHSMITSTPPQLRNLFAVQTIQGFPTIDIYNDPVKRRAMSLDYILRHNQGDNCPLAMNDLLTDLSERLKADNNKELSEYGLPEPEKVKSELELERLKYDPAFQAQLLQQLSASTPNNPEQVEIFNYIANALDNIKQNPNQIIYIFLNGPAGSGKSTLSQKVMAYGRSTEHICLGCASTNLAATNYKDFTSFHHLFGLPVLEDYEIEEGIRLQCQLKDKPEREELIRAATLILCDEFGNLDAECFDAVCQSFDYLRGKVFVGVGDFKQIAPVKKGGTIEQIKMACIQNSKHWSYFQVCSLRTNMRLERLRLRLIQSIQLIDAKIETAQENDNTTLIQSLQQQKQTLISDELGQREYAQMILQIGLGQVQNTEYISFHSFDPVNFATVYKYRPSKCYILQDKREVETHSEYVLRCREAKVNTLRDFYRQGFQSHKMHAKTILAATNKQIDDWNSIVQQMNPNYSVGDTQHCVSYLSSDVLNAVDDPRDIISNMLSSEMLNTFNSDKAPPHILKLCVGDICYLMRTLGRKTKLATNQRVRILELRQFSIKVQTIEASNSPGEVHFLPRIRFRFTLPYGQSYEITRTQFPLRLAYAISINKSQGQQYEDILFDTTHQAFTHGHLYVAMSRITKYNGISFFTFQSFVSSEKGSNNGEEDNIIILLQNIVYPDLIKSII